MKGVVVALFALWLGGCAVLDSHNVLGRMTPPEPITGPLSLAQREEIARLVADTIAERYIDPTFNGVDWNAVRQRYAPRLREAKDDAAFWEELDRMVGELGDSHTRVESPARVERRKAYGGMSYGIGLTLTEGGVTVVSVHPDSDAFFAGLRVGNLIESINGVPAAQRYEQALAQTRKQSTPRATQRTALQKLLDPIEHPTSLQIGAIRADGSRIEATIKPRRVVSPPSAMHRVLPSGFGYLRFTAFNESLSSQVLRGLEALKDTPGLILDLRGNGGGSARLAGAVVSHFMKETGAPIRVLTRDNAPIRVLGLDVSQLAFSAFKPKGATAYTKPVVVLLDEASASASEMTTAALRELGVATVVGQTSCGCLLGFLGYLKLPGGAELAYSEVGMVTASGKRIEGEGVVPDIALPVTLERIRAGRDWALEEAETVLRRKTGR